MSMPNRRVAFLALLGAALAAAGCGTGRTPVTQLRATLEARVLAAGLDPADVVFPAEVTAEMRSWIRDRVPFHKSPEERVDYLLDALQNHESRPPMRYEPGYTGTAREVFETGRFNCLSFSHLFVALARELEVPAFYMRVDMLTRYDREGDLIVASSHVAAGYSKGPEVKVLDFAVGSTAIYRSAEPITDIEALAMYYTNRGAERLRSHDPAGAKRELDIAVGLAPELDDGWINLGVARRRLGDLDGAEAAYRRAIEVDESSIAGYHNLAMLMRFRGRDDVSAELLQLLDRRDNRNPFVYLALGDLSLSESELEAAERFYRRALRLAQDAAEPPAAMGQWAAAVGDFDSAAEWLERARRLDVENERVVALEQQLAARRDG